MEIKLKEIELERLRLGLGRKRIFFIPDLAGYRS